MMKSYDSLRLCAAHLRQLRSVSGSLHPSDEFADRLKLCTFCALHARQLRNVSGALHPMVKPYDSLKL